MMDLIKELVAWLHLHPHWAGFAAFLIAAAESIAILGLLVPGSVMMTGIGSLIGAGILPFWLTTIWAILGAIAGDGISYWLGYHYHEHIREMWPFRRFPNLLKKGDAFFEKHGSKSIMLGRFAGPVRAIVPVIAGMMNMKPRRFLIANITSGIVWAPLYMVPGIIIGATAMELPAGAATQFIVLMLGLILALSIFVWLIRHIILKVWRVFDLWLGRFWQSLRNQHKLQHFIGFIQDPQDPEGHHQLTGLLASLFLFGLFCLMAYSMNHDGIVNFFNLPVFHLMRSFYTPKGEHIFVVATMLGKSVALFPLLFTVTGWFLLRGKWRAACHWFLVVGAAFFCASFFKNLFEHARPSGLLNPIDSASFPSGHTLLSLVIFGFLACLVARQLPKEKRSLPYILVGLLVAVIGFSRLYLGAHWLTDILGSILLGLAILFLGTASYCRRHAPALEIKGLLIVTALTLAVSYPIYFATHYQKEVNQYIPYWPVETTNIATWWQHQSDYQPLYRTSHFGKPIQPINIEWAGSLTMIKDQLQSQGWQSQAGFDLALALKHFSFHKDKQLLPLLPRLYQDRAPVLTLTLNQGNNILVVRLWNAYTYFTDSELPLWYGIADYQSTLSKHKLKTAQIIVPTSSDALQQLTRYLKIFDWKMSKNPANNSTPLLPSEVLLIKQQDNLSVIAKP